MESIYSVNDGGRLARQKLALSNPLNVRGFQKNQGAIAFQKKTSLSTPVFRASRKSRTVFFLAKINTALSTPVGHSGLPENPILQRIYFIAKQIKPFSLSSCPAQLR